MNIQKTLKIPEYLRRMLDKYKYVLLVGVVGIILAIWPTANMAKQQPKADLDALSDSEEQVLRLAQDIEKAFANIEGVGRIQVILTVKNGYESVYAYDKTSSSEKTSESYSSNSESAIKIMSQNGAQQPIVKTINFPKLSGAVVICDGGDNPRLQLSLTQALRSLTGITADNIVITKMRN